jgi:hypothetical protein
MVLMSPVACRQIGRIYLFRLHVHMRYRAPYDVQKQDLLHVQFHVQMESASGRGAGPRGARHRARKRVR